MPQTPDEFVKASEKTSLIEVHRDEYNRDTDDIYKVLSKKADECLNGVITTYQFHNGNRLAVSYQYTTRVKKTNGGDIRMTVQTKPLGATINIGGTPPPDGQYSAVINVKKKQNGRSKVESYTSFGAGEYYEYVTSWLGNKSTKCLMAGR